MDPEQKVKLQDLKASLNEHLEDTVPRNVRQFLLDEIANTPAGKAHVRGSLAAPCPRELSLEVWGTERGQWLRHILEQGEQDQGGISDRDQTVQELNAIENPRKRINAWRKAGQP